jgi:hypothetical protein
MEKTVDFTATDAKPVASVQQLLSTLKHAFQNLIKTEGMEA